MVNEKEASATIPAESILRIGKRRERSIYYRPDGTPTHPLPSDDLSRIQYMKKGFTLEPQKIEPEVEISGIKCPYCGFEPKNALSLRTHLNKHVGEIKEEEK